MPATRYVIPLNCAYRCEHYTTLTNSEDILNGSVIVAEKEVTLKAGQSLQRRPRLYHKHQGQGPESRPVLTSRGPCIINTQHSRTAGIGRSQLAIGHCIINTQHLRTAGSGRSQLFFKYTTLKKTRALKVGQRTLYHKKTRALKVGQRTLYHKYITLKKTRIWKVGQRTLYHKYIILKKTGVWKVGQGTLYHKYITLKKTGALKVGQRILLMVAFSSLVKILGEGSTIHPPPALSF